MTKLAGVVVALMACGPKPGETRCTTVPINGIVATRCETEPSTREETGWFCTQRSDGGGACGRKPGRCEQLRSQLVSSCVWAPCDYSACSYMSPVICADSGCFPTSGACAAAEANAGRNALGCETYQ